MNKKAELTYTTPLGEIRGYLNCDAPLIVKAELEVSTPTLPAQMEISECRVFKWKIEALEDCSELKAICQFEPNTQVVGGPESGQWLDAQGWKNENYILSLGTDDGEYLNSKAAKNIIPKRFTTNNPDGLRWVNYTDKGLEIEVPGLLKGEHIELRFSVAWKDNNSEEDDVSTWYAIDLALD